MPENNPKLISALRATADKPASGARYEWGHMGQCNCGHLFQTLTGTTDIRIVQSVDYRLDEWTEHAKDYCAESKGRNSRVFSIN